MSEQENYAQRQINSVRKGVELMDEYEKEIIRGRQKNVKRPMYSLLFEAFTHKYLSEKKTRTQFMDRGLFESDKTYRKLLTGGYANITKIDTALILRVCLALLMSKEESYIFFYWCGWNLWKNKDLWMERFILEKFGRKEGLERLTEFDKKCKAYDSICKADKILRENGRRGMFINCKEAEEEARKYLELEE